MNLKTTGLALAAAFTFAGSEAQAQYYDEYGEEYAVPCETLDTVGDLKYCHENYLVSHSQPSLSTLPNPSAGNTAAPNTMADAFAVMRSTACQESKSINQQLGLLLGQIASGNNPDVDMDSPITDELRGLALAFLNTEPDCLRAFADVIENNIPGKAFVAEGYRERAANHAEIAARLSPPEPGN